MAEITQQPFLGKEWLVKTNSASQTPYLFKFLSSTIDLTCCVLFTDTKSVWTEELSSQLLARRWRQCNSAAPPPFAQIEDEDEWRTSILELLAKAHTLGGVNELSFEVVDTNYSDIAFTLECDSFKWRWETCFAGYKASADVISKQLVLPLISTNHLLFSSPESVQDMADTDVEKAVDKVGRTARRALDTHVKYALAKPRISTILRRMTAIFDSLHELPKIISTADEPSLDISPRFDVVKSKSTVDHSISRDVEMAAPPSPLRASPPSSHTRKAHLVKSSSATESSDGEDPSTQAQRSVSPTTRAGPSKAASQVASRTRTPEQSRVVQDDKTSDDDDSSPLKPPPKRAKPARASSDESDSESERKARIAQLKSGSGANSGTGGGPAKRGVRQPIKRGGKRF